MKKIKEFVSIAFGIVCILIVVYPDFAQCGLMA